MKKIIYIMVCGLLLVSCGSENQREQKITIKIDVPDKPESMPEDRPAEPDMRPTAQNEAAKTREGDLARGIIDKIHEVKPVLQNIMMDLKCRKLAKAGDDQEFADYIYENHSESLADIKEILELESDRTASLVTARNLIRKQQMDTRRPPLRRRPPRTPQR